MSTPEFIAMSEAWETWLWAYDCFGWELANIYKRDYLAAKARWIMSEVKG